MWNFVDVAKYLKSISKLHMHNLRVNREKLILGNSFKRDFSSSFKPRLTHENSVMAPS